MRWKPIKTAPTETRILVFCKAYKGGGYAIFEAFKEHVCEGEFQYFSPYPESSDDHWIPLSWEPLYWCDTDEP